MIILANLHHQRLKLKHININADARERFLRGGEGFALKRQRHRQQQIFTRIVTENLIVEITRFMAGKEKYDAGLINHRRARAGRRAVEQAYLRRQKSQRFFFLF